MSRSAAAVIAAAALALAGCVSVLPKTPPVQLYRFGADAAAAAAPAPGALTVALGAIALPRAAAGDGLLTITGDEAAYVAGARWVSPAAVLMREAASRIFAARPGLRLVGADEAAPLRLNLAVSDFAAEYRTPGAPPMVLLSLRATLTPREGRAAVLEVNVSEPAAQNRLVAIVPAYDAAVQRALGQVASWTEARARGLPAD